MRKLLLLLLLLLATAYAQNCLLCKPPVKIKNCYQPQCYRCGIN